jgi:hypothetical protein
MDVSVYNITDYENINDWALGENKPNSKPNKANFKNPISDSVFVLE